MPTMSNRTKDRLRKQNAEEATRLRYLSLEKPSQKFEAPEWMTSPELLPKKPPQPRKGV